MSRTIAAPNGATLQDYVDGRITVEEAADRLGPGTSVAEVIIATARSFGRLPDADTTFTREEHRRAIALLGLDRATP